MFPSCGGGTNERWRKSGDVRAGVVVRLIPGDLNFPLFPDYCLTDARQDRRHRGGIFG